MTDMGAIRPKPNVTVWSRADWQLSSGKRGKPTFNPLALNRQLAAKPGRSLPTRYRFLGLRDDKPASQVVREIPALGSLGLT